jgi:hypothetical protein
MQSKKLIAGAFASAVAGAFFASMGAAQASTVYSYDGPNFVVILDADPPAGTYTTSMHVSGSFSVPAPLLSFIGTVVPDAFSFSDGRNTITNLNAALAFIALQTDASGQVISWGVNLATPFGGNVGDQKFEIATTGFIGVLGSGFDRGLITEVTSAVNPDGTTETLFNIDGAASNNFDNPLDLPPGSWSVTPLPAALPLFATGVGGLGLLGWRRKKKAAAAA